jgi:hypothetical protein
MTTTTVTALQDVPSVAAAHAHLRAALAAQAQAEAQRRALLRILDPPDGAPRAEARAVLAARLDWPEAERAALRADVAVRDAQRAFESAREAARRALGPALRAQTLDALRQLDRALQVAVVANEELAALEEEHHRLLDAAAIERDPLAWPYFSRARLDEWRWALAERGYVLGGEDAAGGRR